MKPSYQTPAFGRCLRLSLGAIGAIVTAFATSGCTNTATRNAASVVDYLYPDRRDPRVDSTVTVLRLPLRVGIAFVPSEEKFDVALPGTDRMALLEEIAARFKKQPFVQNIEIIPTAYLRPKGSFENLDQLGRMFDVDVIALVSYDQVQFTDSKRLSLTYLTIVGAYLVEGDKNDTRTLLDAAVFDIASRKLLFRAPGVSTVKGSSAAVNLSDEQRQDSEKGFRLAAQDLTPNLEKELERFRTRVRENRSAVRIDSMSRGSTAGGGKSSGSAGAMDGISLLIVIAVAAGGMRLRKRA